MNTNNTNPRPLAVTGVAWLYIAVGVLTTVIHLPEWRQSYFALIEAVELGFLVCGIFMLRGRNWARWLALAWVGMHVVFMVFNGIQMVVFHAVIFALIAVALLRADAARYFRPSRAPV